MFIDAFGKMNFLQESGECFQVQTSPICGLISFYSFLVYFKLVMSNKTAGWICLLPSTFQHDIVKTLASCLLKQNGWRNLRNTTKCAIHTAERVVYQYQRWSYVQLYIFVAFSICEISIYIKNWILYTTCQKGYDWFINSCLLIRFACKIFEFPFSSIKESCFVKQSLKAR